jgi:acetophenone carboxylase
VAERLGLDQAYVFKLGPVLSAFGSSVAEICHIYEEWGDDTTAIAERGEQRVRRDLMGEGLSDIRIEVEVTDHVTVRGFSPVPVYTPQPRGEHHHEAGGDVLVWDDLHPGVTARGPVRLESDTNTCTVPAGWDVRIDGHDNAILYREGS